MPGNNGAGVLEFQDGGAIEVAGAVDFLGIRPNFVFIFTFVRGMETVISSVVASLGIDATNPSLCPNILTCIPSSLINILSLAMRGCGVGVVAVGVTQSTTCVRHT